MTRNGYYWAALALAAGMLGSAAHAGDIVWARDGDIDSLDPHRATSSLSRQLWYQIYDSLLDFDENGEVVPNLARDWEVSEDGTEITFMLQDGVVCHDGSAFDSKDVVWTAERAIGDENPSITKASWGPITKVEAIDDLTVRFTLEEPFGAFVPFMADQFTGMLCDSNADSDDFGTSTAVGTGPWKLNEWNKGSAIILDRNPDYQNFARPVDNDGPPLEDRLVVRAIPEGQTRVAGLSTGELHVIVPPLQEVERLREEEDVEVFVAETTGQNMFLEFSVHRPPFDDERARKAVAHALNMDQALRIVFGDLVDREHCPVATGVFGHDSHLCQEHGHAHDPDRARDLLAELGYTADEPMEVILATWTGDNRSRLLQVFQHQLRQVGIDAEIEVMDIGTLNARVKQENNKAEGPGFVDLMGWTWFDPDVLYMLWHSPGAYEGYTDPALDELLEATRTTVDAEEREAMVHDVFEHLLDHAVHVPVYTPGWLWMYAVSEEAAGGFKLGPYDRVLFSNVEL